MSGFIQMEPDGGRPATEKTEVWLAFDARNVYVGFKAWESEPARVIVKEMRRDSPNIRQGDCVAFGFDTFYDRRNAVQFEVNALGGRTDGQSTNERQYNADWNPVWDVAVGTFEGGWTVEAAIPFKSLRYKPGREQVWGFQARRNNKWKNEISYLTRVPPELGIGRGSFATSLFATAGGFEAPDVGLNLEVKPYVIGDLTTDRTAVPPISNAGGGDFGVDAKYGLTESLTADFTYNTDFAQVEADEQQVNLTRFSLFFPEKRDFFLENLGTYSVGGAGGTTTTADAGDTPILFYSRRIGLNGGTKVPILGGGRLSGRAGRYSLGVINIETDSDERSGTRPTNFSVVRVKRDILRRSSVGAILTNRSVRQDGSGSNQTFGVDGTFAFFTNLAVNTYVAKTASTDVSGDDLSYRAQLDYGGDRYGVQVEHLTVGAHFNPEVGYLRRADMRKNYAQVRFSPRPASFAGVRKLSSIASLAYIENGAGRLETRNADGEFAIEMQNSDRFAVGISDDYEFLSAPFAIARGVRIPAGAYAFTTGRIGYNFGQQRPLSGNVLFERGTFYDGDRTTLTVNRTHVNVTPQLSLEPSLSINWVHVDRGSFTARVAGSRVTYTVTPLMFASAFVQYNSSTNTVSANLRFRWEYRPGSELFLVFNEERDTLLGDDPGPRNRSLVLKVNRLLRF
jgi:hypothetical protein